MDCSRKIYIYIYLEIANLTEATQGWVAFLSNPLLLDYFYYLFQFDLKSDKFLIFYYIYLYNLNLNNNVNKNYIVF